MRGSVSEVMRLRARGPDRGLRAQHLEDHQRLVHVRGQRRPVGDGVVRQPLRDLGRGGDQDQLPAAAAQLARGRRASTDSRHCGRALEVDHEPADAGASAASMRRPSSPTARSALHLEVVQYVVEALLADGPIGVWGANGGRSEHGDPVRMYAPGHHAVKPPLGQQRTAEGSVPCASVTSGPPCDSMYASMRERSDTPFAAGFGASWSVLSTPNARPWRSTNALPESPGRPA